MAGKNAYRARSASGTKMPWKPKGTRTGRDTTAIGSLAMVEAFMTHSCDVAWGWR